MFLCENMYLPKSPNPSYEAHLHYVNEVTGDRYTNVWSWGKNIFDLLRQPLQPGYDIV